MFGFIKEVCDLVGIPYDMVDKNIKIHWLKDTIIIENFKKILMYEESQVVLLDTNRKLNIEGNNIKVVQLSSDEIVLSGIFDKVYFDKVGK